MGIEWHRTMEIQDGIQNTMGQFRMGLGDPDEPQVQRPISLYDIQATLERIEQKLDSGLDEIDALEYQLAMIEDRVWRPWYLRFTDWLVDQYDRVRTALAGLRRRRR